ncbi:MAG: CapA family protein [Lachnospiraceae bacterium]|nr:CapA family protein [Lachnospiraceae bacterium]
MAGKNNDERRAKLERMIAIKNAQEAARMINEQPKAGTGSGTAAGGRAGAPEEAQAKAHWYDKVPFLRTKRLRILYGALLVLILSTVLFMVVVTAQSRNAARSEAESAASEEASAEEGPAAVEPQDHGVVGEERVSFLAVGDNLIHRPIYKQALARGNDEYYDFVYAYQAMKPLLDAHDINWINMETLVNGVMSPSSYPKFITPPENAWELYDLGFRIFNLGSNHTYDFGVDGVMATVDFYENEMPADICTTGIWPEGEGSEDIPVYEYDGHTFAFLCFVYGSNKSASGSPERIIFLTEEERMKRMIAAAREQADAVIVACHWGDEYNHHLTSSERSLSKRIAEWGADLIIGTHPHVIQDFNWLETSDGRKVFCIYSLGNFLSGQNLPETLVELALSCQFVFREDISGKVTMTVEEPKLIPLVDHYWEDYSDIHVVPLADYTPELAEKHGIRNKYPEFSYSYILKLLKENIIGDDVLVLPDHVPTGVPSDPPEVFPTKIPAPQPQPEEEPGSEEEPEEEAEETPQPEPEESGEETSSETDDPESEEAGSGEDADENERSRSAA